LSADSSDGWEKFGLVKKGGRVQRHRNKQPAALEKGGSEVFREEQKQYKQARRQFRLTSTLTSWGV
jgi:hypothetical protein